MKFVYSTFFFLHYDVIKFKIRPLTLYLSSDMYTCWTYSNLHEMLKIQYLYVFVAKHHYLFKAKCFLD